MTLLIGNHDFHYFYPDAATARFDVRNYRRNNEYFNKNIGLFQVAAERRIAGRRFLFTHAGMSNGWSSQFKSDSPVDADMLNNLWKSDELRLDFAAILNQITEERGGFDDHGSIIWADIHEFTKLGALPAGIIQIVGHTHLNNDEPLAISDEDGNCLYCLDCRKAFILDEEGNIQDYHQ